MPYDKTRDRYPGDQTSNGFMIPEPHDPARNWYTLADANIGAAELPTYARSMRVRVGSTATPPLVMVVVAIGEGTDATTRTITVDATENLPFGVRRIVSLNGGTTVPTGIEIQMVTD
jgi:hypothetical protein